MPGLLQGGNRVDPQLASPIDGPDSDDELHYLAPVPNMNSSPGLSRPSNAEMQSRPSNIEMKSTPSSTPVSTPAVSRADNRMVETSHASQPPPPPSGPVVPLSEALLNRSNSDAAILSEFTEYWAGDAHLGIVREEEHFVATVQLVKGIVYLDLFVDVQVGVVGGGASGRTDHYHPYDSCIAFA